MKNKVRIRRIAAFAVVAIAIVGGAYFLSNWFENTNAQEVVETPLMDSNVEPQNNPMETEVTSDREVKYLTQEVVSAGLTMAVQSIER